MNQHKNETAGELLSLCDTVRTLAGTRNFEECKTQICQAMCKYPHAPQPHNLMGIVLQHLCVERQDEDYHLIAMKHFRAAYALDPTYLPSRHNLHHYGTFYSRGHCAFDESDCEPEEKKRNYTIKYDEHGIGHVVKENKHGTI